MRCGLLGRKLEHSYSPSIHACLGDYAYELFQIEPEELENFLKFGDFDGLNVTIPYKKDVIPFLDELTPEAQQLGAVNTIVRRNDRLIGHNTDYFGFRSMLDRSGLSVAGKKCLVCGSGGASNTVCAVLKAESAQVVVLSRYGSPTYAHIADHADAAIVVNCTPVGMYPNVGISPLELEQLPHLEGVLDVIYNPARTALLMNAEQGGLVTMNGLWMLVAQAVEASEWFQNKTIDRSVIHQIYTKLKNQMENIVLIGMPGCGKTTIGRLLSAETGKTFVDTDALIVEKAGMPIPELFARYSEAYFRQLESEILAEVGKKSGQIIATGGGCVTRKCNYPALHQNGTIIWIRRDPDLLPTDGRPLSQKGQLHDLLVSRHPLYTAFADRIIDNSTTIAHAVEAILKTEAI